MPIISNSDKEQLKKLFLSLRNPVKIITFTQEFECNYCQMTRELLHELSELSDKISIEVYDFVKDAEIARSYGIDKIPAIILMRDQDYGIRFYGVPAGYEFTSLVEDIIDISIGNAVLSIASLKELEKVDKPVHIQVLISPTCPYCAQAVRLAHKFAMSNDFIRADMIELSEFPYLSVKYDVKGVPKIVINEKHTFIGSLPEADFLKLILKAIGK
ncbi:MAG: thioredoxin family protein [Nitrospirae bacterium]|nr:thioredoxin family protein [Nitrospirota bacterium]